MVRVGVPVAHQTRVQALALVILHVDFQQLLQREGALTVGAGEHVGGHLRSRNLHLYIPLVNGVFPLDFLFCKGNIQ